MKTDWEDLIALNSSKEKKFEILKPAAEYYETDARKDEWDKLDFKDTLRKDIYPLPTTEDREGYYGPHHFSYWASGLEDARNLVAAAKKYKVKINDILDLGCASGRVIRHFSTEHPKANTMGCDINRLHVEWCNANLAPNCTVFQNHSIPSLPLESNSVDLVSAFSVFTHIEAFETTWLMEIQRILRPGGLAWITVHTEDTLEDMKETWPLWKPIMNHPDIKNLLDEDRKFAGERLLVRWSNSRSYSSNVFYKKQYLKDTWGRFFEFRELRRRFPRFQDVIILQKKK